MDATGGFSSFESFDRCSYWNKKEELDRLEVAPRMMDGCCFAGVGWGWDILTDSVVILILTARFLSILVPVCVLRVGFVSAMVGMEWIDWVFWSSWLGSADLLHRNLLGSSILLAASDWLCGSVVTALFDSFTCLVWCWILVYISHFCSDWSTKEAQGK